MGQYKSHDFLSYVGVLLAALIATGHKRARNGRRRCHRVRLAKSDFVPKHGIRMTMKPRILADHYPAVGGSIPTAPRGHSCPTTTLQRIARGSIIPTTPLGRLLASTSLSPRKGAGIDAGPDTRDNLGEDCAGEPWGPSQPS